MALEFIPKKKPGVLYLEPIAGLGIRPPELTLPEVIPPGAEGAPEIDRKELAVSEFLTTIRGSYIKPPGFGKIEYDPPTKSLMQKIFFDLLQRDNFIMAGVFRTQLIKAGGIQRDNLTKIDKELEGKHPQLTPVVRDALAVEQLQKESFGLTTPYMQAYAKGEVMGPIGAAIVAFMDLTLKKDTEGAAAIWAGATVEDKTMFMDLAEESGIPRMLGLIADIGLSPINYLPIGFMIKNTVKGVGKIPGVKAALDFIKETDAIKMLTRLFVPGGRLPKKYWLLESTRRRQGFAEEANIWTELRKTFNSFHGDKRKVDELMLYVKQHPGALNTLSVADQASFAKWAEKIDRVGKKLVLSKDITLKGYLRWKETYMYGYYPNYTKVLSGNLPPTLFQRLSKPSFSRPKMFTNIADNAQFLKKLQLLKKSNSVDDAIKFAADNLRNPDALNKVGAIETAIGTMDDMKHVKVYASALQASYTPEKSFLKLTGMYLTESGRLYRRRKFINDVTSEFGIKVPNIFDAGNVPPGMRMWFPKGQLRFLPGGKNVDDLVDGFFKTIKANDEFVELTPEMNEFLLKLTKMSKNQVNVSTRVSAFFLPEEIGMRLNKLTTAFWADPATDVLFKYLDKYHMLWKGMATAARLPFHLRNFYSNIWLMYAADVAPVVIPRRMEQAATLAASKYFPKMMPTIKRADGFVMSSKQILERAINDGVLVGWMGSEMGSTWKAMSYFNKYGKLRAGLDPIAWGRKLGSVVEGNARLALYIDRLIKGDSFQDAAQVVFKNLYDYSPVGLTLFEARFAKRAAGFYTWFKQNTVHMVETFLMKPHKFANTGKAYTLLYDMAPETREERVFKPEYMDENMWIRAGDWLPKMAGQTGPLYYHIDIPPESLTIFPGGDWEQVLNLLTLEGLKPLIEVVTNRKTFPKFGMEIEKFPGQKVPAPTFMAYIPEGIKKILGIGPYVDQQSGKVILGIRAKTRHLMYSMIPPLGEIAKMFPQNIDIEMERSPWRVLTYMTGIGFTPIDLKQQKWLYSMQRRGKLGELQQYLLQEGRLPTQEEWTEFGGY